MLRGAGVSTRVPTQFRRCPGCRGRRPPRLGRRLRRLAPPAVQGAAAAADPNLKSDFGDFVAFDIETSDFDIEACEIVEIAAVRVRRG